MPDGKNSQRIPKMLQNFLVAPTSALSQMIQTRPKSGMEHQDAYSGAAPQEPRFVATLHRSSSSSMASGSKMVACWSCATNADSVVRITNSSTRRAKTHARYEWR